MADPAIPRRPPEAAQAQAPAAEEAPKHVQKLDAQGRAYATGKRKDAVARVWIKPGTGTDHRQRPSG